MDNSRHSTSDRPHTELRALVVKNFKLAGEVKYKQFSAKIYRIKRAQLAAELQRLQ